MPCWLGTRVFTSGRAGSIPVGATDFSACRDVWLALDADVEQAESARSRVNANPPLSPGEGISTTPHSLGREVTCTGSRAYAPVAQWTERHGPNVTAGGSNPSGGTGGTTMSHTYRMSSLGASTDLRLMARTIFGNDWCTA